MVEGPRATGATQEAPATALEAAGAALEAPRAALEAPRAALEAPRTIDLEVLAQALRLVNTRAKETFRAPVYTGDGDVELFLRQFMDVAEANGWAEAQQALHMWAQLQGTA